MQGIEQQIPEAKQAPVPILSVLYKEFSPETYKGVRVSFPDGRTEVWRENGFDKDFAAAEEAIHKVSARYLHASSLDNFISDRKRRAQ